MIRIQIELARVGQPCSAAILLISLLCLAGCGSDESTTESVANRVAEQAIEREDTLRLADIYVDARRLALISSELPSNAFGELVEPNDGEDWLVEYHSALTEVYAGAREVEFDAQSIARAGDAVLDEETLSELEDNVSSLWELLNDAIELTRDRATSVSSSPPVPSLVVGPIVSSDASFSAESTGLAMQGDFGELPNPSWIWHDLPVGVVGKVAQVENYLVHSAYVLTSPDEVLPGHDEFVRQVGVISSEPITESPFYYTGPLYFAALVHDPNIALDLSDYHDLERWPAVERLGDSDVGGCGCGVPAVGPCDNPVQELPDGAFAAHALEAAVCGSAVDWDRFLEWMTLDPLADPEEPWWMTRFDRNANTDWSGRMISDTFERLPVLAEVAANAGLYSGTSTGGGVMSLSDFCNGHSGPPGVGTSNAPTFGPALCQGCGISQVDCTPEQFEPPGPGDGIIDHCGGWVDAMFEGCDPTTCDPALDNVFDRAFESVWSDGIGDHDDELCLAGMFGSVDDCDAQLTLDLIAQRNAALLPGQTTNTPSICDGAGSTGEVWCQGPTLCTAPTGGPMQCVRCDLDGACHRVEPPDVNPFGGDSGWGEGVTDIDWVDYKDCDEIREGLCVFRAKPSGEETGTELKPTLGGPNEQESQEQPSPTPNEPAGLAPEPALTPGDQRRNRRRQRAQERQQARDERRRDRERRDRAAEEGDPVVLATGQFLHQQVDQVAWGTPGAWRVQMLRTYNVTNTAGALGLNWSHGFEDSIEFVQRELPIVSENASSLLAVRERYPDYCYQSAPLVNCIVRRSGNGGATLYVWDALRYVYVSANGNDGVLSPGVDVSFGTDFDAADRMGVGYLRDLDRCALERNCRQEDELRVTIYRHLAANGVVTEYDHTGRVLRKTATSGEQVHFSYDSRGNLHEVSDDRGKQMQFRYGVWGLMTHAVDLASGNTTEYCYDLHILPAGPVGDAYEGVVLGDSRLPGWVRSSVGRALNLRTMDALAIAEEGTCYRLRRGTPTVFGLWVAAMERARAALDPDSSATPEQLAEAERVLAMLGSWYAATAREDDVDGLGSFDEFREDALELLDERIDRLRSDALVSGLPRERQTAQGPRYDWRMGRNVALLTSAITTPTSNPTVQTADPQGYRFEYSELALNEEYQLAFDPTVYENFADLDYNHLFDSAASASDATGTSGSAGGSSGPAACASGPTSGGWYLRARELAVSMGRITRLERLVTDVERDLLPPESGAYREVDGRSWRTTLQNAYDFNFSFRDLGTRQVRVLSDSYGRIVQQRYGRTADETVASVTLPTYATAETPRIELQHQDDGWAESTLPLFQFEYLEGLAPEEVPYELIEIAKMLYPLGFVEVATEEYGSRCAEALESPGPLPYPGVSLVRREAFGRLPDDREAASAEMIALVERNREVRRCVANAVLSWVRTTDRDGFERYIALSPSGLELFSGAVGPGGMTTRAAYFDESANVIALLEEPRADDPRLQGGAVGVAAVFGETDVLGATLPTGGAIEVRVLDWENDDPRARGNVLTSTTYPGRATGLENMTGDWLSDGVAQGFGVSQPTRREWSYEPIANGVRATRNAAGWFGGAGGRSRVVYEYEVAGSGGESAADAFLAQFGIAMTSLDDNLPSWSPVIDASSAPSCVSTPGALRPLPVADYVSGPRDVSPVGAIPSFTCLNDWGDVTLLSNGQGARTIFKYATGAPQRERFMDLVVARVASCEPDSLDCSDGSALEVGLGLPEQQSPSLTAGGPLAFVRVEVARAWPEVGSVAGLDDLELTPVRAVNTAYGDFVGGVPTTVVDFEREADLVTTVRLDSMLRPVRWTGPERPSAEGTRVQGRRYFAYDGANNIVQERRAMLTPSGPMALTDSPSELTFYFDAHNVPLGTCVRPAGSMLSCRVPLQAAHSSARSNYGTQAADENALVLSRIEPTRGGRPHRSISRAGRQRTFTFDELGRPLTLRADASFDEARLDIHLRYDALGRLQSHSLGGTGGLRTYMAYDGYGRSVASRADGQSTQFVLRDGANRVVVEGVTTLDREAVAAYSEYDWGTDDYVDEISRNWRPDADALSAFASQSSSVVRRNALGLPELIRNNDALELNVQQIAYSPAGEAVYVRSPDGTEAYSVALDSFSHLRRSVDQASSIDHANVVESRPWDAATARWTYEARRPGPESIEHFDVWGRSSGQFDIDRTGTHYFYDSYGRLEMRSRASERGTSSGGSTTELWRYDADGLMVSVTDPASSATAWTHDAVGRMVSETGPGPHTQLGSSMAPVTTQVRYDQFGRTAEHTEIAGSEMIAWSLGYVPGTSMVREYSTADLRLSFERDRYGNLMSGLREDLRTGDSVWSQTLRDASGRVLEESWDLKNAGVAFASMLEQGQTLEAAYTVSYDYSDGSAGPAGELNDVSSSALGPLVSVVERDRVGRVLAVEFGGGEATDEYAYAGSALIGRKLSFGHRSVGENWAISTDLELDAAGRVTAMRSFDGAGELLARGRAFDIAGRPTLEWERLGGQAGFERVSGVTLDGLGRVESWTNALSASESDFLTVVNESPERTHLGRALSGLTSEEPFELERNPLGAVASVDYGDDQVWSAQYENGRAADAVNGEELVWDSHGRLQAMLGLGHKWSADHRVVAAFTDNSSQHRYYDAFGRLVRQIADGEVLDLTYVGQEVVAERSGDWSRSHWIADGLDGARGYTLHCSPEDAKCDAPPRILEANAVTIGESGLTSYATLSSYRNDVHAVVDARGQIVESYAYDLRGSTTMQFSLDVGWWESKSFEDRCVPGAELEGCGSYYGNVRRFSGARWDLITATYLLRARGYAPALGMFSAPDPLGYVDSYDEWMYVGGNPFGLVDPLGLGAREGGRWRFRFRLFAPTTMSSGDISRAAGNPILGGINDVTGQAAADRIDFARDVYENPGTVLQETVIGAVEEKAFDVLAAAELARLLATDQSAFVTELDAQVESSLEPAVQMALLIEDAANGDERAQGQLAGMITLAVLDSAAVAAVGYGFAGAAPLLRQTKCFVAGTLVLMADGSMRPIESIEVGDLVAAYDHDSEEYVEQQVTQAYASAASTLVELELFAVAGADVTGVTNAIASASRHEFSSARNSGDVEVRVIPVSPATSMVTHDGVIVGFRGSDVRRFDAAIGSRYVPGDLHGTDVTPALWRRLVLELAQPDGGVARVAMLRPLWWLDRVGAEPGSMVALEIAEAGLEGVARLLSVSDDVLADSRELESGTSIVIATIRHDRARVLTLVFDGDESRPLGVTPNHPIFSEDRAAFVPAGELRRGENIRTESGELAALTASRAVADPAAVYNLEVHTAEAYFVGSQRLLVHNTRVDCSPPRLPRYDGPKPRYHVNNAHVPGRGLGSSRVPKTPLPGDAASAYANAVPNSATNPSAWFGRGANGQTYRFSPANDGTAHYSGTVGVGGAIRNFTRYARDRLNGL